LSSPSQAIGAVLFDFGGVLLSSPFPAFDRYEEAHDLPQGFLRSVNSRNSDTNALARFERGEIHLETFEAAFAEETAELGHRVPGRHMLTLIAGPVCVDMMRAVQRIKEAGLVVALLTSSFGGDPEVDSLVYGDRPEVADAKRLFDIIVDSSLQGVRKPELAAYEAAVRALALPPAKIAYLDDLGINLKPARELGMHTIKVTESQQALSELEALLGLALR
jgi:putative hydrolase of the HAD superfamily